MGIAQWPKIIIFSNFFSYFSFSISSLLSLAIPSFLLSSCFFFLSFLFRSFLLLFFLASLTSSSLLVLSFFFHSFIPLFSFNPMEVLLFLAFGPPLGSHFGLASQTTCGLFGVSSSLRGRVRLALCNIPCSSCGTLFSQCGMVQHQKHYQVY